MVIEFEDDGPGMDAETASRAFNPFFTTKKDSGGTGLGLATVAKVAREHGGHVELDSTPGRGTTVRVTLPAARPRTSDAAYVTSPSEACEPAMVGRRVLLVEDEALVARSTARTLQRSGHQIDIASDGLEAIERFRQSPAEVVVMDVDMPVMDGPMCYQRLCALDPEVKVIFISGKSSPSLEASLLSLGAQAFVPKPLDFRRLSRAIRRAVTGASTPPNEEPA